MALLSNLWIHNEKSWPIELDLYQGWPQSRVYQHLDYDRTWTLIHHHFTMLQMQVLF